MSLDRDLPERSPFGVPTCTALRFTNQPAIGLGVKLPTRGLPSNPKDLGTLVRLARESMSPVTRASLHDALF